MKKQYLIAALAIAVAFNTVSTTEALNNGARKSGSIWGRIAAYGLGAAALLGTAYAIKYGVKPEGFNNFKADLSTGYNWATNKAWSLAPKQIKNWRHQAPMGPQKPIGPVMANGKFVYQKPVDNIDFIYSQKSGDDLDDKQFDALHLYFTHLNEKLEKLMIVLEKIKTAKKERS